MPELSQVTVTRVVATQAALDAAQWPADALVFRTAPDELFVYPAQDQVALDDAYAIVLRDGGHAGVWLPMNDAMKFLGHECEWELPGHRPAYAQGSVAGIPAKLYFEDERVFLVVFAAYAEEFTDRMNAALSESSR
ncbi:MAG: hypothetical protein ACI9OU_001301 [Candidatus Promineifilaceae bacterium]